MVGIGCLQHCNLSLKIALLFGRRYPSVDNCSFLVRVCGGGWECVVPISGKVNDLHNKTCAFICDTFQNIFLPRFEVADMVVGSPLGHSVTRKMLQLSHGYFREKLIKYAASRHRNLYLVGEEFTTKTCGHCGHVQEVGASKVYNCQNCRISLDRDENAARNICLKFVSKFI